MLVKISSGVNTDCGPLVCDARWLQMFQREVSPPFSGLKSDAILKNVGYNLKDSSQPEYPNQQVNC